LLEVVGGLNDLFKGSRQPRETPDHQSVAWAHVLIAETCNRLIKNAIVCWNYLLLEHRLSQASTDELRAEIRAAVANHSVISWEHINLLGEYDFSDEKLRDSVGIPPPKIVVKSHTQMGGTKTP
jgi:hypothetical protein